MDRISAARARILGVKAELRSPAVQFPCIKCRYYELACTHPAVSEISANPESGRVRQKHIDAALARSEGGACGPEGALFDSRSPIGLAVISVVTSKWFPWVAIFAVAALGDQYVR